MIIFHWYQYESLKLQEQNRKLDVVYHAERWKFDEKQDLKPSVQPKDSLRILSIRSDEQNCEENTEEEFKDL